MKARVMGQGARGKEDFNFLIVCLIIVLAFTLGIICGGEIMKNTVGAIPSDRPGGQE